MPGAQCYLPSARTKHTFRVYWGTGKDNWRRSVQKKGGGMGGVCFSGSPPTFKHSYQGLLSYTRDPHRLRDHNRHEIRRM